MPPFPGDQREAAAAAAAADGKGGGAQGKLKNSAGARREREIGRDEMEGDQHGPARVRLGYVDGLNGPCWDTVSSPVRFPWALRSHASHTG